MRNLLIIILTLASFSSFAQSPVVAGDLRADSIRSRIQGSSSKLNIVHRVDDRETFVNDTTLYDFLSAHGGGSVSFGTDNQIPFTNSAGNDFDYSASFTYNGTDLLNASGMLERRSETTYGLSVSANTLKVGINQDARDASIYSAWFIKGISTASSADPLDMVFYRAYSTSYGNNYNHDAQSEVFRLNGDGSGSFTGKLGIGSSTHPSIAHVYESTSSTGSTAGLTVENASTGDAVQHFIAGGTTWSIGIDNSGGVDYYSVNPTASLDGLSGIGFSISPANGFTSFKSATNTYGLSITNSGGTGAAGGLLIVAGENSGSGTLIQFNDGDGTDVGEITFSGTTTTYGTSSDKRLKEHIKKTSIDPKKLIGLAKDFTWKSDGKKQTGFIAQDVYKVFPWAVHVPDSGMWSVDYGAITPLLAKGYEDNEARISELEKENKELRGRLEAIEKKLSKLK